MDTHIVKNIQLEYAKIAKHNIILRRLKSLPINALRIQQINAMKVTGRKLNANLRRHKRLYVPFAQINIEVTMHFRILWKPSGEIRESFPVKFWVRSTRDLIDAKIYTECKEIWERIIHEYIALKESDYGNSALCLYHIWHKDDKDREILPSLDNPICTIE